MANTTWPFESQKLSILDAQGINPIGTTDDWSPNQITAWDVVVLGDYVLPGISKISGLSRTRKYQIVKNKETHFGEVKDLNLNLATFTIENTIIKREDLDQLVKIINYFDGKLGVTNFVPGNTNSYTVDPVTGLPVTNTLGRVNTSNLSKAASNNSDGLAPPQPSNKVVTGNLNGIPIINPLLRIRGIDCCFVVKVEGPILYRTQKIVTIFECIEVKKKVQSLSKAVKPTGSVAKGDAFADVRQQEEINDPAKDPANLAP